MNHIQRCSWAGGNELEIHYHDNEWGVPEHDELRLFENLILESMQAGLSWSTILKKRETLREAYDQFQPEIIAQYGPEKVNQLLENPGVIRHQLKIMATISNAQHFLEIQKEFGSFDQFIWSYVKFKPINNLWERIEQVPGTTELSIMISKDLKKRGFKFLGATTIYAFLQSSGLVNDHVLSCFKK